jgi:hypothetical protein
MEQSDEPLGERSTATDVQPPPAPLRNSNSTTEAAEPAAAAGGAGGRFDHRRVVRHWHSDSIRQLAGSAVLLAGANAIGMAPAAEAASTRACRP